VGVGARGEDLCGMVGGSWTGVGVRMGGVSRCGGEELGGVVSSREGGKV